MGAIVAGFVLWVWASPRKWPVSWVSTLSRSMSPAPGESFVVNVFCAVFTSMSASRISAVSVSNVTVVSASVSVPTEAPPLCGQEASRKMRMLALPS
jgi:hypothetical protein